MHLRKLEACLCQTTTLGVRWRLASRAVLEREMSEARLDGRSIRVKTVQRPGSGSTAKAEMDDIAAGATGAAERASLRWRAEHDDEDDGPTC